MESQLSEMRELMRDVKQMLAHKHIRASSRNERSSERACDGSTECTQGGGADRGGSPHRGRGGATPKSKTEPNICNSRSSSSHNSSSWCRNSSSGTRSPGSKRKVTPSS
eukprot:885348-Prymnesium_polylepis.2